jgi:hypothetical protein
VTLIIITLIIKYITTYNQEDFTNDESVQNVASLYNQAKLTVTDFTSTGTSTLNTVNATTTNTTTLVSTNGATINGVSTINDIRTNGITNKGNTTTDTIGDVNGGFINGLTQLNSVKVGNNIDVGTDINVGKNLTVGGNASLNNANVKGRIIFPTKDGVSGPGGTLGVYVSATDANDCLNKCLANQSVTCSSFRKSDKMCHGWGIAGYGANDPNWSTTLFF